MSTQDFLNDIDKFIKLSKLNMDQVVSKTILDLATSVVVMTPVAEKFGGTARGNWQFGVDQIPEGTLQTTENSMSRIGPEILKLKAGHIHYVVNNLPYIGVLEDGGYPNPPKNPTGKTIDGYSRQAPHGMVKVTVGRFVDYWQKAVSELPK